MDCAKSAAFALCAVGMPINLETSPDWVDGSMSNPQLSVTLEDSKTPVPATTPAAAAATPEKPLSSAPADPAKSASIAPPVLAKLAFVESSSTGPSTTPSTSTGSTATGSTSTRTATITASSQPPPSDRPTSTDHPATEVHSITPSHSTPPASSAPTPTTPPTSPEPPPSSSEAPAAETSTSSSTAEPSSTTSDPPGPEPTVWESPSPTPEWTPSASETATTSWSETQSPPAETPSSSWTSDWTESSSSWTAPLSSSSHSLTVIHSPSTPSPTMVPVIPAIKLDPVTSDPPTTVSTSESTSPLLNTTTSPVLKAGGLTTSVQPVSTDGLITSDNATAEVSTATDEAQVKKIAGMPVGWFAGLIVAIFVIFFTGCFIFARWRKKRSSNEAPLDGFDSDHESKRPMTKYDASFTSAPSLDRASSFFNSSSSSKFVTPITPHQENLAGRGNAWQAPTVPAPTYDHPRASRYMPTSGRAQQPTSAHPSPDQSGMESNEILADYYPDSDYEQLDEPKALAASKRKTTATARTGSTGSVYSIDSMWGNASEAPPTARSSLTSSFLPWRRPTSEAPAVPAIPEHVQRASPDTGRYAPAAEPTTRLPPRAAMAQTPVAVRQKPGFGEGGFVLPLGGFSR